MKNAAVKSVKFGCMDNMVHTRGVRTKTGTVARIDPAIHVARVIGHYIRHDANEIVSVTWMRQYSRHALKQERVCNHFF